MNTRVPPGIESIASKRPSSQIRRTWKQGRYVYEKQYVPDDWGGTSDVVKSRARQEVRLIELMQRSGVFQGDLGTVQIESSDPDQASISTFEIPGKSLDECLHDRTLRSSGKLIRAFTLAGEWIRRFQTLPLFEGCAERQSALDPTDLRAYCQLRLDSLSDYGYSWPSAELSDQLLKRITESIEASSADDLEEVWVHADFAPGNLLWDGEKLTPIDFAMAHGGRRLEDVVYLIHRLEMQAIYRPWIRWPVQNWRRAILGGYGHSDAHRSPMYQALMIKNLICRIHTYVRRPARSQKQAVHDRWVRYVLRRRLKQFAGGT